LYQFIGVHQQQYKVQLQCRVLGVSRSGYYSWSSRKTHQPNETKREMEKQVIGVFGQHRCRYGARRIAKALQSTGEVVGRYKAGRILNKYGLKAIQPRSFVPKTTDSRHSYTISPHLLLNKSLPSLPNEVWVGDITYLPLSGGQWCYLAVWMDLFSRKIIGWHIADNMQEGLIIAAFKKAIRSRSINPGLIVHSDRGGQYAGNRFRKIIADEKMLQSMSRADNPYDNAAMESYFSRYKAELLQDGIFDSIEDARTETFEYIEMYYNTQRMHSSLGYSSPAQYEQLYEQTNIFAMHKQTAMLYTEETPLMERGIEPLPIKHKQSGLALPKE
jgi:putative transposase